MAGVPAYITPLSYIRGSGTQYITTEINLRSTDVIKSRWRFENSAGNVYGCFSGSSANDNFCLYAGSASTNAYIRYNGQVVRDFKAANDTIYDLEHGPDGFTAGSTSVTFTAATFTCSAPMYIFMLPNSSSAKVKARCYGLRIYRDGALAYNFIPARNELTSEVGLFEAVNGVWYGNAGTGTFTAGDDLNYALQPLLLRRRMALLGVAKQYATRIKYIRGGADGSYIDTGITADNTVKVIVWARNFGPATGFFFGSRVAAGQDTFGLTTVTGPNLGRIRVDYAQSITTFTGDQFKNMSGYHKYELYDGVLKVDDVVLATAQTGTFVNNYNIHLLGTNTSGTHSIPSMPIDICACQIYKNNILVRDFTPVNSPNIGLYDAVSGEVFTNAGSGAFTYGTFNPDAYTPLEYIVATADQWFDTPAKVAYGDYVVAKFRNTETTARVSFPFGVNTHIDNTRYAFRVYYGSATSLNSRFYMEYGQRSGSDPTAVSLYNSTNPRLTDLDLVFFKQQQYGYLYRNNTQLSYGGSSYASASFETKNGITIGTASNGKQSDYAFKGYIYYVGVGSKGAFVPAKVNGVAGMYDTYNDIFYSSETSTPFIAGPEL